MESLPDQKGQHGFIGEARSEVTGLVELIAMGNHVNRVAESLGKGKLQCLNSM